MITLAIPCYVPDEEARAMTENCIRSLGRDKRPDEIIIVDDGSPVNITNFNDVKIVRQEENGGYMLAANRCLSEATGDVIIIGNNDLVFKKGWLDAILKPLNEGYDVSSVWVSDQLVDEVVGITENPKFGAIFAIKREVYEDVGGFDETFGDFYGDTDLRKRLMAKGYRIGRNNEFVLYHLGHQTYKKIDPSELKFKRDSINFEQKYGYGQDD